MWGEIVEHLAEFPSAVLTGVDAKGYPFSIRCRPEPDDAQEELRIRLLYDTPAIRPGPASLLCHSHDENLWNQKSFLVRGTLSQEDQGWSFHPQQFIPGAGTGGLRGMVGFIAGARKNTKRYLRRRRLARPSVPWDEIETIKRQAKG